MIGSTLRLIWKEWREAQWFFFAALALFLGIPLVESIQSRNMGNGFESDTLPALVLAFGAVLAIFVAVGATTRDMQETLRVFWQSRPIGLFRWVATKFCLGFALVFLACLIPTVAQIALELLFPPQYFQNYLHEAVGFFICNLPAVLVIFSVAFLSGILLRNATQAMVVSLAVGIVVYVGPLLIPSTNWLSVWSLMENQTVALLHSTWQEPTDGWTLQLPGMAWRLAIERPVLPVALTAIGASSMLLIASYVAVKRDWRFEMNHQVMFWSLGGVLVVLFGATANDLGTNLSVQRSYDLPIAHGNVARAMLAPDGRSGVLALYQGEKGYIDVVKLQYCSFSISASGDITYGPVSAPTHQLAVPYFSILQVQMIWDAEHPEFVHVFQCVTKDVAHLYTIDLRAPTANPSVHDLDFSAYKVQPNTIFALSLMGKTLYLSTFSSVFSIDVSDPSSPKVITKFDSFQTQSLIQGGTHSTAPDGTARLTVPLPTFAKLSPQEALRLRIDLYPAIGNAAAAIDGDHLVTVDRQEGFAVYQIESISAASVTLKLVGRSKWSPLQRLAGTYLRSIKAVNGFATAEVASLNVGMNLFDYRDPSSPRMVGRFSLPRSQYMGMQPLSAGETLVAADRLYFLDPPRGR